MIYNLDEYETFIKGMLRKTPLCLTAQLIKALCNTYKDMDSTMALKILLGIQRRGFVLLSPDGWAMTKGVVQRITQQKFVEEYIENEIYRLPSMKHFIDNARVDYETINCLWIAIDMLPSSENMVLTDAPWNISFIVNPTKKHEGKLYQITSIPKEVEDERCELLRTLPKVKWCQFRDAVSRIALIEDEKHAWMVPHVGFTYICKLNPKTERMYSIIEKREAEDIWSDYPDEVFLP